MSRTLADISQDDYEAAEATVTALLNSADPTLDLRTGTALADLVVSPTSQLAAYNNLNISDLQSNMSFLQMQANPEAALPAAMDNLASNYNLVRRQGTYATGSVLLVLGNAQEYALPAGYQFSIGALNYVTTQVWNIVNSTPADFTSQVQIMTDAQGGYYVVIPLRASAAGAAYNAVAGTAMTMPQGASANIRSATVYDALGGGTDAETNTQFMTRIPIAMSQSEFSSEDAITTRLMNQFPEVTAVSVIGMGDEEMLRDKHNVFGGSFGGRVDVYLKTFRQPYSRVLVKAATYVSDGVYAFTLLPSDAPGYYCIRSITSPGSILTAETNFQIPAIGSLPFTESRYGYQVAGTFHDFSPVTAQQNIETAYSMWQASTVTVTNVPPLSGGSAAYPAVINLKVEIYMPQQLAGIQAYIDGAGTRNKESDTVARTALLAFVTVTATVYAKSTVTLDMSAMQQAVADYINTKTFGDVLTASQLSSVLHQYNIVRVGLDNSGAGMQLAANVRGADGIWRPLSGSCLNIGSVADAQAELTAGTTLFVADPRSIFLTAGVA
jgi:uncharacterized phage protein gp47/JayE